MNGVREKRCPLCRRMIHADAAFCRHCNTDLEDADLLRARRGTRRTAVGLAWFFGAFLLLIVLASLIHR